MGKVTVAARVQNLEDLYKVDQGAIPSKEVRQIEIPDALVDTGATSLGMPGRLIQQLGLRPFRDRRVRTSAGPVTVKIYNGQTGG